MMRRIDWNKVEESGNYPRPVPGGYIAQIVLVQDEEAKEYLRVHWDFAAGDLKGNNRDTAQKFGFWPMALIRSYKESALGFFKTFKGHLEKSNPGYLFDEMNLAAMHGKYIGVILGEEEYINGKGEKKDRMIVTTTKSVQDIQNGEFTVPKKKLLKNEPVYSSPVQNAPEPMPWDDGPLPWDDGPLPWDDGPMPCDDGPMPWDDGPMPCDDPLPL